MDIVPKLAEITNLAISSGRIIPKMGTTIMLIWEDMMALRTFIVLSKTPADMQQRLTNVVLEEESNQTIIDSGKLVLLSMKPDETSVVAIAISRLADRSDLQLAYYAMMQHPVIPTEIREDR